MTGNFVPDHFSYFVRPVHFLTKVNLSDLFFVPILEDFPFLIAYALWKGSVIVPVPLKVFT